MAHWRVLFVALAFGGMRGSHSNDCPGTEEFLNAHNIDRFDQCTHIRGNLVINDQSVSNFSTALVFYEMLYKLINITEIDGYLIIEGLNHSNLTNLRFLRNLERIHGMETVRLFGVQDYTLVIQNNPHLLTLNLASLKSIENGGLRVLDNPQLCLVDSISIEDYLVNSTLSRTGGLGYICSVVCHGECVEEHGCWGTLPDECVACRGFKFHRTCVETCNLSISIPNYDLSTCIPISSQPTTSVTEVTHATIPVETNHQQTTSTFEGNIPSVNITVQTEAEIFLLPYLVPSGVASVIVIVMTIVVIASTCYCSKRKKSKKLSLREPKTNSSLCGTPEKYSRSDNDKTILVSSCEEDSSPKSVTRSPNISISSLATASIHSDDRKNDFNDQTTPEISLQAHTIPLSSTTAITRRNSTPEQAQNSNSSASYYTPSNGDTGYNSNATSRKPSLVGSRASSTSAAMVGGVTGGNVYSTGQHQLHPHRQLHHQYGIQNQRGKGLLTSQANATSTANANGKPASGDNINISVLANNSGYFEAQY